MIAIGIDIGWSQKRPSCCLAVKGVQPNQQNHLRGFVRYEAAHEDVWAALFTLDDLVAYIPLLLAQVNDDSVCLVVDGPIGGADRPHSNRHVDSACRQGGFARRAQPVDVTTGDGPIYVDATYRVLAPFFQWVDNHQANYMPDPWMGGTIHPHQKLVFAETNPTVAMAVMLPPQEPTTLPSRKRRLRRPNREDGSVNAKSDWYWQIGVANRAAAVVGSAQVSRERNHERVAGLFCLMLAQMMRQSSGAVCPEVIALGDNDGVYAMPRELGAGWENDVTRVGINLDNAGCVLRFPNQAAAAGVVAALVSDHADADNEALDSTGGDEVQLFLCDNGSVWEKHNDWLEGVNGPVRVSVPAPGGAILVTLTRAQGSGQWMCGPTPLNLARQCRGFTQPHLSLEKSVQLAVTFEADGV